MTDLQDRVVTLATACLGVTEHPPGSNRGPEIDSYLRRVGLDPTKGSYPWCASFVSAIILDAADALHLTHRFRGSASVERLYDLNQSLQLTAPVDCCVFVHLDQDRVRRHDHCGFLLDVATGLTCEGNSDANGSRTGGSVVTNVRAVTYFSGFLRIT